MPTFIALNRLPQSKADALFDRIVTLDDRIFFHQQKEDQERFSRGVRDLSVAEKTLVLYEEKGELIGYNLIKIQPMEVEGKRVWAVGSVAGFLPGHTGGNRTMLDAIRVMLRYKLRYPQREFYFVSFLLNPGGYALLVEACPETYPSLHRPVAQGLEHKLIETAARASGTRMLINEPTRIVTSNGRPSREPFVRLRDGEHIRYFEELNPQYAQGELLGVCAPLGARQLLSAGVKLLRRRLAKLRTGGKNL
jgi:hypothetical protein